MRDPVRAGPIAAILVLHREALPSQRRQQPVRGGRRHIVEEQLADIPRHDLTEFFSEPNPAESGKTLGIIVIDLSADPYPEQVEFTQTYAEQLGWEVRVVDLKGEVGNAGARLEAMVQADVDVIVTGSMGPDLIGRNALESAVAAGVPVISTGAGVPASTTNGLFSASVEFDLLEAGRSMGRAMVEDLPEGAKIALLYDQQAQTGRTYEEGLREVIGDRFNIVAEQQFSYEGGVPGAAADASAVIQANPDIAAFWCPYDAICTGAANAVVRTDSDIALYSKGGSRAFLDYIEEGVDGHTIADPMSFITLMVLDQAVKLTKGEGGGEDVTLNVAGMITRDNIEQAEAIVDGTVTYGPDLPERFFERWGVN